MFKKRHKKHPNAKWWARGCWCRWRVVSPQRRIDIDLALLARACQELRQEAEEHIHQLAASLPLNSGLRLLLDEGMRGDGIRYPWMDDMRREGIKLAEFYLRVCMGSTWQGAEGLAPRAGKVLA